MSTLMLLVWWIVIRFYGVSRRRIYRYRVNQHRCWLSQTCATALIITFLLSNFIIECHGYLRSKSGNVQIQVSFSVEDHSAVQDGQFSIFKYSRMSLYIASHPLNLDRSRKPAIKQPFLSYLSTIPAFQTRGGSFPSIGGSSTSITGSTGEVRATLLSGSKYSYIWLGTEARVSLYN